MATRCFCPPEIWLGYASALVSIPTRFNSFMPVSSACSFVIFFNSTGANIMFPRTVLWGKRLKCWNTMPIFSRSLLMSVCLSVTSSPSTIIVPSVAVSSWFRHRRNVDLPLPEGPRSTTTSPSSISMLISFSTSSFPKLFFKFFTCTFAFLSSTVHPPLDSLGDSAQGDNDNHIHDTHNCPCLKTLKCISRNGLTYIG